MGMEKRLEQQSSKVADLEDYIDSLLMRSGYPQCGPISCVISCMIQGVWDIPKPIILQGEHPRGPHTPTLFFMILHSSPEEEGDCEICP